MNTTVWTDLIYNRRQRSPVTPPAGITPDLHTVTGVKAVVFDIYGTLFSSGVGDISLATEQDRDEIIKATLIENGYPLTADGENIRIDDELHTQISLHQKQRREEGITYPEVEIRAVWTDFLKELTAQSFITETDTKASIDTLVIDYESRVNPTQAIPGLEETLQRINDANLKLSIISNAQFYTPLLFETYLQRSIEQLGFDATCSVWSYVELEGKPSKRLYELAAARLSQTHSIAPHEVLYVGNDIRNDIWPAQAIGFKTALFAGDHLSLRLRKSDPACNTVKPDLVVTDLRQLMDCLEI